MENVDYICLMKVCKICEENLPEDSFWKNSRSSDGLNYICKECSAVRRKTKLKLSNNYYIQDRDVLPEEIPFYDIPHDVRYTLFPSEEDREILNKIIRIIQLFYGVTLSELVSGKRFGEHTFPRYHFYWFVNKYKQDTYYNPCPFNPLNGFVGKIFGQDHAMFRHGCKVIDDMLETDAGFKSVHEGLVEKVAWIILPSLDKRENKAKTLIKERLHRL